MAGVNYFDQLRKHYEKRLPFVAYRKPMETKLQFFLQENDELNQINDFTEAGFVFAPFDDKRKTILIPEDASRKGSFEPGFFEESNSDSSIEDREANYNSPGREEHINLINKSLKKLKVGELQKVVVSRKEEVNLNESDPLRLFEDLLLSYRSAFVYVWFHPGVGLWLGATPETLLKVQGRRFETMALAGTRKYEGSMGVNWGEKEKQEQRFVTDEIVSRIRTFVPEIKISEVFTSRAGNLVHLRTDISGFLEGADRLQKIVRTLHPTPAVCGIPKEKAKQFILAEEGYDREFYTGFLGELNLQQVTQRSGSRRNVENQAYRTVKKETSLFVNLRCMKIENRSAFLFMGGGITEDSDPESEWEETVNKGQTMKKVLSKQTS